MPFILIKGTFHVVGFSPDGDSIRFKAKLASHWNLLPRAVDRSGMKAQLRLEGIDALETHYRSEDLHQPKAFAEEARDELLSRLGITNVVWGEKKVTSADDETDGYILTRDTDGKGRPVCFVFAGDTPKPDGKTDAHLTPKWLKDSVNYKLAAAGLVYPMYYETLYYDLRNTLTAAVASARATPNTVWAVDKSPAVKVTSLGVLQTKHPVFPKLFRRLAEYLSDVNTTVSGFKAWLAQKNEKVFVLSRGQPTHFDTVVEQTGKTVKLTVLPEDLVFEP